MEETVNGIEPTAPGATANCDGTPVGCPAIGPRASPANLQGLGVSAADWCQLVGLPANLQGLGVSAADTLEHPGSSHGLLEPQKGPAPVQ